MAATDQLYRSQKTLDIVFAVSSVLMLASVVWMFAQDYNREFKAEQRQFRDVVTAMAERTALERLPPAEAIEEASEAVKVRKLSAEEIQAEIPAVKQRIQELTQEEKTKKKPKEKEQVQRSLEKAKRYEEKLRAQLPTAEERDKNLPELKRQIQQLLPAKEKAEARYQAIKADLDSRNSFYDIAVDKYGPDSDKAKGYKQDIETLQKQLAESQSEKDAVVDEIRQKRQQMDGYERPLTEAQGRLKKLNDEFDAQAKIAILKKWGVGDFVRNLPILDGFASPIKIQQFTLESLPIDYNFKHVTRFDRCMTCHLGIDRNGYTREGLRALLTVSPAQQKKLDEARQLLEERKAALEGLPEAKDVPDPDRLTLTQLSADSLTESRINEFCVHPRLHLFVGSNSKHPAEKFGCTSCHAGQGSATDFFNASHAPDNFDTRERWHTDHDWKSNHFWDFPMFPRRFVESSCLKCHHQVTDLVSSQNRNEAPKLLRGYSLLKENGCFGCHEIAGRKNGRAIGPDLRLEATPPLESLPPAERVRILADPDNAPGDLRKVGPSLYRLSEKTNEEWTARWLRAPRDFRPDTKMPHFYGLSNNHPGKLSDEFDGESQLPDSQKKFPDAEIHAITFYLFQQSRNYLDGIDQRHKDGPEEARKDQETVASLEKKARDKLSNDEKDQLDKAVTRIQQRQAADKISDLPLPMGYKKDLKRGRELFTERGCLACHHHQATMTAGNDVPPLLSEAQFGPNLSQLKAKLGKQPGDEQARRWLMQWIKDPHVHSPRSRMPVTHLENDEVADVAAWLLEQEPGDLGAGWANLKVPEPDEKALQNLADVYLIRLLPRSDIDRLYQRKLPAERANDLPQDERELARNYDSTQLKMYLGKKAILRLGCFGCHDIPGFDNAKSIGVGLNDWGKKDAERLAFEDSVSFLKGHFNVVDRLTDAKGKPVGFAVNEHTGKKAPPYERFFADALEHHQRDGFLHLKLLEPRSYDYNRIRPWDDRARMPQFKFARSRKRANESDKAYEARNLKEEAEAREAVMTFILGLVAEPIPFQNINTPSGDRLAEVKGRQVLDKYNCGGCHLVRPGVYEFNVTAKGLKDLKEVYETNARGLPSDHYFPEHKAWVGDPPPPGQDRLTAVGFRQTLLTGEDGEPPSGKSVELRLTQALRFKTAPGGDLADLRAFSFVSLRSEDMVFPPADVAKSPEKLADWEKVHGPYGGTFANLLVDYLIQKNPQVYKKDLSTGDSSEARVSAPPSLLGEGEKTQPDWLFQFLLNPQPVRRMTVLRMPRFNMSEDEARALVNYFAGVERLTNPGIGLTYPYAAIPQQGDFKDEYWRHKNAEYIDRLKASKVKGADGKESTAYDRRQEELKSLWDNVAKEYKGRLEEARAKLKTAQGQLDQAAAAEKKLADAKDADAAKKKAAEDAKKQAETNFGAWESEVRRQEDLAKRHTTEEQQTAWREREAYVTDAYKLLVNPNLCLKCHQVGNVYLKVSTEGPPLELAHTRLRPEWTKRWIAHPQRFLTYASVMPQYFANDKSEHQEWFVGSPLDQVIAVRDVLMIYPQAADLPQNRYWALPVITGDTK